MASVTEKPQPAPPRPTDQSQEERLVDREIGRTRRAIKLVDFTAGLITLVIGVLVFLLTMAVLEHWVIPGGWSDTARSLLFGVMILAIAVYSWRTFRPLLGQAVNPAYAALAIEQSRPSLKNSLLNLLLLRRGKQHVPRQVFQAVEQQAAQRLSQVSLESVVDRSAILRLGYLLVAIVALCAIYRLFSPKDPFSSAGRVLLPWSNIATPSRVQILTVTPGETKAARGDQLAISAEVTGLGENEPVRLLYSSADEQIVRQEIPMSAIAGGSRFECQVPTRVGASSRLSVGTGGSSSGGNAGGIQQDFVYWIEAGDARSARYQVTVFARPTLVVERLRYEFPAYTGYPSRDVAHTGDIRAVEGTRVTLFAQANKPIKSAHVDFEADGLRELLMQSTEREATVTFPLTLREDRRTPRYQSYVLRYLTTAGNQNEQPPKYLIDVQPDYSPEIELLLPAEALLEVALNQEVEFELEARDPDFALSQVILLGKVGEKQVLQAKLLSRDHTGRFVGKLRKTPQALGLKVGDVMEYWGAASDNRRPEANLAYTAHRKLRVKGPWQGNQEGQQNPPGEDPQQQGEGNERTDGEGGQQGQAGGGQQGNSGSGESDGEGAGETGQEAQDQEAQDAGENGEAGEGQGPGGGESSDGQSSDRGESRGDGGGATEADTEADSQNKSDAQSGEQQRTSGTPGEEAGADTDGGSGGDAEGKVSSEGDDDSTAFERMAEHFKEQEGQPGSQQQEGQAEGEEGGEQRDPSGAGESASGQESDGSAGESRDPNNSTQDGSSDSPEGESTQSSPAGKGNEGDDATAGDDNGESPAGDSAAGEQSTGDQAAGEDQESPDAGAKGEPAGDGSEQQAGGDGQQQEGQSPDGQMSPEQGEAGGGESGGEQQGGPSPEQGQKPQDKQGDPTGKTGAESSEAPAQSRDQTESDSTGGQGGDRSGGGKEGAGQQANEEGQGGAGQNQPADDGAGQAADAGAGETGDQPGRDEKAAGKTGESSGDQAGGGSQSGEQAGETPGGENASDGQEGQPGSEPAASQPNENSAEPSADQPPTGQPERSDAQGQAGNPNGSGGTPSAPPPGGETEQEDQANLDYARKQTELILDRLDDQLSKQEVDQSLLEKLGWSQDELRKFVDRWKNLQSQADDKSGSPAAKAELSDALRSLGLRPDRRTSFQSQRPKDKLRDLQDAFRGRVPLEFQEQIRSYVKGTAAAQEQE